ncbi:hypothetical protein N7466_004866 [Penicillium verhagenii]|uniref:uncharacterized protein n=1 Tax=Penicillium verhagenii TaxID=1562060 RepID=UPI002545ADEF|nr:uncharacterized protein N7466_004866 [Penicillium verhagenii]KAJ5935319.1 hypothetical protein N7466_004866 [Penicillium verhagenii]
MYIPQKRSIDHKNSIFIVVFVVIVFVLAVCAVSFFLARYLRQRHYEPKYIPGTYFKRKWKQWQPGSASYGQVPNQGAANGNQDTSYQGAGATNPEMTTAGVQRETSIRSIITLPAYSPSPKPTEQIIGREGEREGMDMVVEFPETSEEQEARREDQMESLYQVRLQRRQELADREARRRERRSARSRGDIVRLEELAAESRARTSRRHQASSSNTSLSASTVIAEQQSRERERRISSVSYASIGRVRHDGSRLRADSHESDHQPLLENAVVNASSPSLNDQPLTSLRSRGESLASSILTTDTGGTDSDPLILRPSSTRGSSRPASQLEEGEDLGTLSIQPPPEYEHLDWGDAPAYESPTREGAEEPRQLASILTTPLPSIQVDIASPVAIRPSTPTEPRHPEDDPDTTPRGPTRTSVVSEIDSESTPGHAPVS